MNSFTPKRFYYNLVESNIVVLGWTNSIDRLIYIQGKMHDQLNSWEHNKYKLREWETLNLTVTLEIWLSLSFHQGEFTPLLAEKVAYSLKSVGRPSKKTTEMQQLPHQSQAEILGLLLGGHTIQNRTRVCSRNQKF